MIIKHGNNQSRIYKIWCNMKYRCNTSTCNSYKSYGGRGIIVCEEWNNFDSFLKWSLLNGYSDNLTIDRKDNNGNYEPSNCQWITKSDNTAKANKDKVKRKANNGLYYGESPLNEYFEFSNASEFARNHNLNDKLLRAMANGTKYYTKLYNGWKFGFVKDKCVSTIPQGSRVE